MSQEIEIPVYSQKGKKTSTIKVSLDDLGGKVKKRLMKEVILLLETNARQGTRCTKTRGKIRATSQKPFRQKGLGRARAGNRNSPIWVGGATAHGPKNQNFNKPIPQKIRRAALGSALISKIQCEEILVIEEFVFDAPKTKAAIDFLTKLKIEKSTLIANHDVTDNYLLSFQNLEKPRKIKTMPATDINVLEVMKRKNLVITQQGLEDLVASIASTNKVKVAS